MMRRSLGQPALHPCPVCSSALPHRDADRCPQCGAVLRIGLRVFRPHAVARLAEQLAAFNCSWDAAEFVIRGFRIVRAQQRGRLQKHGSLSAATLWSGLLEHAQHRFGTATAAAQLESFGLKSGEDIGKVVFALVAAGYLRADDSDDLESFSQLPPIRATIAAAGKD